MRKDRIADALFALSALVFGAAFYIRLHTDSYGASVFYFLAQSALIGCGADWFAVTALFRRPLGISWHTALIPRSRMRIIRSIRQGVEKKLLAPGMWDSLVGRFSLTDWICTVWTGKSGSTLRGELLDWAAQEISRRIPEEAGRDRQWQEKAAGYILEEGKAFLRKEGAAEKILAALLKAGEKTLQSPAVRSRMEEGLREYTIHAKTNAVVSAVVSMGEAMGVISYKDMADSFADAAIESIRQWEDPQNRVHLFLKDTLERVLSEVLAQPDLEGLAHRQITAALAGLTDREHLQRLSSALDGAESPFRQKLAALLDEAVWDLLRQPAVRDRLDGACRSAAADIASYEHSFLGDAVEQVLSQYDEKKLNTFIYSKVSEELGTIRIHGALVAAAFGSVLFAVLLALGQF